jgi:hypothetical protein
MNQRVEEKLANVIHHLDDGDEDAAKIEGADELARVLAGLKSVSIGLPDHKPLDKTRLQFRR